MSKNPISRRQFLQTSAVTTGALMTTRRIALDPARIPSSWEVPPSDRVRFGIIGVGMQGSGLLATAVSLPGVECVAASDLYDGRHALAKEIAGSRITTTRRYKELLDNKEIDCIIAAVPDHWHKQVFVDAVSAGKDIYCEKPMSHSAADGIEMVNAAKNTGRVTQIGSQRVSSVICAKARELLSQGIIGDLNLVEASLGRNDPTGAWVISSPARPLDANPGLGHLAGHRAETPVRRQALCPLALLEGIWHGRRWRSSGTSRQRYELHARVERAPDAGHVHRWNSPLQ